MELQRGGIGRRTRKNSSKYSLGWTSTLQVQILPLQLKQIGSV